VQTSLTAIVKDCIGHDFPVHVKTKEMQCTYLSLAIRKAATSSSEHVFWVSPEVWSYVSKESAKVRGKIA
jgi:putative exporter of polyketide antibiotics